MFFKKYSGVAIIILLSVIPILLWFPSVSSNLTLISLSQALAMCGAVLFSLNFVLSARLKFLENFFNGLNRIYIIHHLVGQFALIFLVLHPGILALYYLRISFEVSFDVLFPPLISGFATWFGMAALIILISLLILTLYIKLPYNIWKFTHKFLGLSLMIALLHIFFIQSTVSVNIPLRLYMLSVVSVGLISYTYRVLLGRILVKRYKFEVTGIEIVNSVTKITLKPITSFVKSYLPGQFIFISFKSLGITSEVHPFSLTSISTENNISIAAKSSGDYTETLKLLKNGSVAQVEGPFGRFSYKESRRNKQIWIAGGIGVTPFVSMAKSLNKTEAYDIYFYYVVSEKNEAIFLDLFQNLSETLPNFKLIPVFTKTDGRITAETIRQKISDLPTRDIFVCGPPPMMKSLRSQFNGLGIRNWHIFSEEFSLD